MRVFIVDDDALVAQSLSTILSVEDDVEVVGLGCSGPEATERYRELTPDILLMDIQMPGGDGLSAAERILAEDAGARIVFLTTFSDDEYIVRALKMGARGYLIKQDVAQVAPALRSVMAGVCVLEGEVLERSTTMGLGGRTGGRGPTEEGPGPTAKDLRSTAFAALTDREYEVVEAVAEGHKTQVAVNNEGKTNEATKHLKEPLKSEQTEPTADQKQKQERKARRGRKL